MEYRYSQRVKNRRAHQPTFPRAHLSRAMGLAKWCYGSNARGQETAGRAVASTDRPADPDRRLGGRCPWGNVRRLSWLRRRPSPRTPCVRENAPTTATSGAGRHHPQHRSNRIAYRFGSCSGGSSTPAGLRSKCPLCSGPPHFAHPAARTCSSWSRSISISTTTNPASRSSDRYNDHLLFRPSRQGRSPPPGLMVKLREGAAFLPASIPAQGATFLSRAARSGSKARSCRAQSATSPSGSVPRTSSAGSWSRLRGLPYGLSVWVNLWRGALGAALLALSCTTRSSPREVVPR
jgi:hypothetical protein